MTNSLNPPHPETSMLVNELHKYDMGTFVSYADLSTILGREVTGADSRIQSAKRALLSRYGQVWGTIRGEGLKRLDDRGIASTGHSVVRSVRRKTHRANKQLSLVDLEQLDDTERREYWAVKSLIEVVTISCTATKLKRIAEETEKQDRSIPVAVTLKLLQ